MSNDFRDLLCQFNAHDVEFLIVGAHALAVHGHVRATKDMDVWVRPEQSNAVRVLRALAAFGAPLYDLTADDLATPGVGFQIGVAPIRIDVLTAISNVSFEDAYRDAVASRFQGEPVRVLSRHHLIQNKSATGRLQDRADVEWLENNPPPDEG